MKVMYHTDAAAFLRHAGSLLQAHEACNNLILGICGELADNPIIYGTAPPVMATVEEHGVVLFAALQTPPHRLIVAQNDHYAALDHLANAFADAGHTFPGVLGPRPVAERFATHLAARTGMRLVPGTDQRIYQLATVHPPAAVPGRMRRATEEDRPLLEEWFVAFQREALNETNPVDASRSVTRWLSSESRQLAIWEDGASVSMAGAAGRTPQGIRIGAVYTPPEHRRRGYASALVAALSQAQLDAGRQFCFLYTDLSNPTSNHIYQAIGYTPVVDIAELHFVYN